jgi:Na+-transporting methylmalonyl-CoA/oxaloacetate decarboxylase gamma subunit
MSSFGLFGGVICGLAVAFTLLFILVCISIFINEKKKTTAVTQRRGYQYQTTTSSRASTVVSRTSSHKAIVAAKRSFFGESKGGIIVKNKEIQNCIAIEFYGPAG